MQGPHSLQSRAAAGRLQLSSRPAPAPVCRAPLRVQPAARRGPHALPPASSQAASDGAATASKPQPAAASPASNGNGNGVEGVLPKVAAAAKEGAQAPDAPSPGAAAPSSNGAPPAAATDAAAAPADAAAAAPESKSDEYSEVMNRRMGTSLTYRHELGIDFNRILPDLIVGSCLQTAADVDRLADEEGVTTVFCLQEDSDMAYFNLDIKPIQERCAERGDIKHVRFPIRDFDPYDLRRKLPRAVSRLVREHRADGKGTLYIHCTAGMGRAPATALAYMYWIRGMQLDEAHTLLTSLRRCGPKIEAIRSATSDLLLGTQPVLTTIAVHRFGDAKRIQVAGLDVGWHQPLDMVRDPKTQRFVLHRKLYPGKYQYKFIVDGVWSYSADHPTAPDGFAVNNTLEVIPANMSTEDIQRQVRLLSSGTYLTTDEQEELRAMLDPWHNDGRGGSGATGARTLPDALQSLDQATA